MSGTSGQVSVDPQAIDAAASSLSSAAGTIKDAVPTEVGEIGSALPGSQSAAAASYFLAQMRDDLTGWATAADAQVEAMRGSAASWVSTDTQISAGVDGLGDGLRF